MPSKMQDKRAPNSEACLHSASNQKQLLVTSGAPSKAAQHSHPDAASGKEGTTSHEVPARPGKLQAPRRGDVPWSVDFRESI